MRLFNVLMLALIALALWVLITGEPVYPVG